MWLSAGKEKTSVQNDMNLESHADFQLILPTVCFSCSIVEMKTLNLSELVSKAKQD